MLACQFRSGNRSKTEIAGQQKDTVWHRSWSFTIFLPPIDMMYLVSPTMDPDPDLMDA